MEKHIYEQMAATEDRHWWFVARRKIFTEVLGSSTLPAAQQIVDVGCGTGGNLTLLRQFGDVVGLELNADVVTMAATHGQVVLGGDTRSWPIAANSVDMFTAFDVLEHIADDKSAMLNLFASLKPGGSLVLSVPAYPWLWSEHDESLHHQRRYVLPDIVTLAASVGFSVEYASYHNCILFPVSFMLRIVSRFSGGLFGVDENRVPAQPINRLLQAIYSFERHIVKRKWRMPFGLSIIAVLRKPGAAG
ncbi:MAG: class I SAM-dependent methyltransferase [Pseudomonadales bacterium]